MKKVCVVTGYRSDYTKLKSILYHLKQHREICLDMIVFGAHLLDEYGKTFGDIEADKYVRTYKLSSNIQGSTPITMAKSVGIAMVELASMYEQIQPDLVLLVGDRYEILAAATAASVANIPVAHVQGGEKSGTVDETIRHAITKLSHLHFPSTQLSAVRICAMGENPQKVFNVGCPAMDYIEEMKLVEREDLKKLKGLGRLRIDLTQPYAILLQHPVTTEYDEARQQMDITLEAMQNTNIQTILLYPNPDAGSDEILRSIRAFSRKYREKGVIKNKYKNLSFDVFLNLLKHSQCLVGNSSSGIREAHAFGIPVINIGTRQSARERTLNIIDVPHVECEIVNAIEETAGRRIYDETNLYGNGTAGKQIVDIILECDLTSTQKSLYGRAYE